MSVCTLDLRAASLLSEGEGEHGAADCYQLLLWGRRLVQMQPICPPSLPVVKNAYDIIISLRKVCLFCELDAVGLKSLQSLF